MRQFQLFQADENGAGVKLLEEHGGGPVFGFTVIRASHQQVIQLEQLTDQRYDYPEGVLNVSGASLKEVGLADQFEGSFGVIPIDLNIDRRYVLIETDHYDEEKDEWILIWIHTHVE